MKDSAKENTSKPSPPRTDTVEENSSKPSLSSKESAKENTSKPSPSRKESAKENTSKPSPKKGCFEDKTDITRQAKSDTYKTDLNAKKVHVMKQGAVKKNILECVIVGEKVI